MIGLLFVAAGAAALALIVVASFARTRRYDPARDDEAEDV